MFWQCSGQQQKAVYGNSKPISHDLWNNFVKKYVSSSGHVNYKSIKQNPSELEAYLTVLKNAHPAAGWTENERKAYWINAYNAFTIKLIIDNYPVKSIKEIGGAVKSPWDLQFIIIEGKKYSLGDIEHNILRKEFNDPRVHFAINCASVSCPRLMNQAYLPSTLDKQLNDAAISFVNDPSRNTITASAVEISEIFKWFSGDFTKTGSLIDFLNKYTKNTINKSAKIKYLTYNWNLNE
jgi:hypothetical protein